MFYIARAGIVKIRNQSIKFNVYFLSKSSFAVLSDSNNSAIVAPPKFSICFQDRSTKAAVFIKADTKNVEVFLIYNIDTFLRSFVSLR